jgi:FtsH-binding integral membrane protein
MVDPQPDKPAPDARRLNPRAFLAREWPYLLVLILAIVGVAYTSFAKTPITTYWVVLAPFIGVICVVTSWPDAESREQRLRLIWTQALHWGAVLVTMHLMYVADVSRMMNADASALAALTVLALGTFTAGIHIAAWRICLVGIVLALGVPAIAWLEQSALLLLLIAVVLVAVIALFLWHDKRTRTRILQSQ